ncbi:MAG: preprotein translocase subunit SecG [Burkholderiaceae bacterium]
MTILASIAIVIQVLSAIGVIVLVLLQQGKGADMGAAFGTGSSGSLFGATGSANFLSRMTAVLATVFFASTLALAFVAHGRNASKEPASVMDRPGASATSPAGAASSGSGPASGADSTPAGAGTAATGAASIPGAAPGTVPAAPGTVLQGSSGSSAQKNEASSGIPK